MQAALRINATSSPSIYPQLKSSRQPSPRPTSWPLSSSLGHSVRAFSGGKTQSAFRDRDQHPDPDELQEAANMGNKDVEEEIKTLRRQFLAVFLAVSFLMFLAPLFEVASELRKAERERISTTRADEMKSAQESLKKRTVHSHIKSLGYFTYSPNKLFPMPGSEFMPYTALTSQFSHIGIFHLGGCYMTLRVFLGDLVFQYGRMKFVQMFLLGGALAATLHSGVEAMINPAAKMTMAELKERISDPTVSEKEKQRLQRYIRPVLGSSSAIIALGKLLYIFQSILIGIHGCLLLSPISNNNMLREPVPGSKLVICPIPFSNPDARLCSFRLRRGWPAH